MADGARGTGRPVPLQLFPDGAGDNVSRGRLRDFLKIIVRICSRGDGGASRVTANDIVYCIHPVHSVYSGMTASCSA